MAYSPILFSSTVLNLERRRERQRLFGEEPLYAAAGWIASHLPAEATIGAWNAGMLAFFSQRRVVNLDGLVNSREFFLADRHDLCAYFDREDIDYLVDAFDVERPFAQYEREIGRCVPNLVRIWSGPAYPGSSRGAMAFRRLSGASEGAAPEVPARGPSR